MTIDFIIAQARDSSEILKQLIQFAVIFLFSLSFHEAAHAWMANRCGDDTARLLGRMTLNPIPHIDPIGTILIPAVMFISSLRGVGIPMLIGWAKPVPVNPLRFRDINKGELLVSLAGPVSNLILVLCGAGILRVMLHITGGQHSEFTLILWSFFRFFVVLNVVLFVFNMIPIPPLDGSHILKLFLPRESAEAYDKITGPFGFLILIVLINLGIFRPIINFALNAVERLIHFGYTGV